MSFRARLAQLLALVTFAALSACSGEKDVAGPGPVSIRGIVITPGRLTIRPSQSAQFRAYGETEARDSMPVVVHWSASGGTIDPQGVYTASADGSYDVSATDDNGHHAVAQVTVVKAAATPSASECATPRAEWIWCDDFEQDRLSKYFEYDNAGGNFLRTTGVGLDGSTGMRGHWTPGAKSAGALHLGIGKTPSSFFKSVDGGTRKYREIYWRMYLRNQAGWVGGGGDKMSRAFVFADGNWSQAAIGHVWSGTSPHPTINYLMIDPASGTDGKGTLVTRGYNDFPDLHWLGSATGSIPMFDASHVGQWYCVEAHMRLNNPGAADGMLEVSVNGTPQARRTGLNYLGSYSQYGINAVYFENYWNAGSPVSQDRYFDNIVVSTAPIGCRS